MNEVHYLLIICVGSDDESSEVIEPVAQSIPVVGLMVQGSQRGVDLVLFYLKNKMPVVIVKGSGGVADLLAYAFEESQEKFVPCFSFTAVICFYFAKNQQLCLRT